MKYLIQTSPKPLNPKTPPVDGAYKDSVMFVESSTNVDENWLNRGSNHRFHKGQHFRDMGLIKEWCITIADFFSWVQHIDKPILLSINPNGLWTITVFNDIPIYMGGHYEFERNRPIHISRQNSNE